MNKDKNGINRKTARAMYLASKFGGAYIVRNIDNICYVVDHGVTELIKTEEGWEDADYGFDENVFEEFSEDIHFLSWKDSEPLDIEEYLTKNGWIENGEFI